MRTIFEFIKSVLRPRNLFHYDNILALGIFFIVLWGIGSIEIEFLNPISDAFGDVELTDIVFSQFDKNDQYREVIGGETELDSNIVLVNIGNLSRGEIGDLMHVINAQNPKVVGLDIMFRGPRDSLQDIYLTEALAGTENLVLACQAHGFKSESIDEKHGIGKFESLEFSYEPFTLQANELAIVNVVTEEEEDDIYDEFAICRKVIPEALIESSSDTIRCFGVEMARQFRPASLDKLHKRNMTKELINYVGNIEYYPKAHFKTYDWYEILDGQFDPKHFEGKMVLMGFLGETLEDVSGEDRFFTPLNPKYIGKAHKDMYGVVVHANLIAMILRGNYIDEMSDTLGIIFGILLAYLVFAIYRPIYFDYKVWYDGVTKLIGIVVVFLIMTLTGYVFLFHDYEVKFHPVFLGVILLAGDYLEIYYGLGKNIARKFKRKKELN